MKASPVLLATCGNSMAEDDGFGPHLARYVEQHPIPGVETADLQVWPDALLDLLVGRQALIVADAAICPEQPIGRIIECDWGAPNRPQLANQHPLSSHGMTISEVVELARSLGLLPRIVRVIVVNIGGAQVGKGISDIVAAQAAPVRTRIAMIAVQICADDLQLDAPRHGFRQPPA